MTVHIDVGVAFECKEHIAKGIKQPVTVVVLPIHVLEDVDTEGRRDIFVSPGCSFHWNCENMDCTYSRASHELAKNQRRLKNE